MQSFGTFPSLWTPFGAGRPRPKQIWAGHDGFIALDIFLGAALVGKLVVTHRDPPSGMNANEDRWYWSEGTAWPSNFEMRRTANPQAPGDPNEILGRLEFHEPAETHATALPHRRWRCVHVRDSVEREVGSVLRWSNGAQEWYAVSAFTEIWIPARLEDVLRFEEVTPSATIHGRMAEPA